MPTSKKLFETRRLRSFPLQLKYAVILTLCVGFTSLIMIFAVAWFLQRNYSLFMGDELGISSQVVELVRQEQKLLETSLFVLFFMSIAVTFTVTFWVTRKLIGPIIALQKYLWLVSSGDWSREFRLRTTDEFKELEPLLNQIRKNYLTDCISSARSL